MNTEKQPASNVTPAQPESSKKVITGLAMLMSTAPKTTKEPEELKTSSSPEVPVAVAPSKQSTVVEQVTRSAIQKVRKKQLLRKSIQIEPKHWDILSDHVKKIQRSRTYKYPRITESSLIRVMSELLNKISYDYKGVNSEEDLSRLIESKIVINP